MSGERKGCWTARLVAILLLAAIVVGCSSSSKPGERIEDPSPTTDPADNTTPAPAPSRTTDPVTTDPTPDNNNGCSQAAPGDANCSCTWRDASCSALDCKCDPSCAQPGADCLLKPDGQGGWVSSDPVISRCGSATCQENDVDPELNCALSDCQPPPAEPEPVEPPSVKDPICTGDCFCRNDDAEAPWPVGTPFDKMGGVGGSNNWILVEDNPPTGGALGPEDRQWVGQDGRVYAGTDAAGNITGAPNNELGVPVGEDLGDLKSFYARIGFVPTDCPTK